MAPPDGSGADPWGSLGSVIQTPPPVASAVKATGTPSPSPSEDAWGHLGDVVTRTPAAAPHTAPSGDIELPVALPTLPGLPFSTMEMPVGTLPGETPPSDQSGEGAQATISTAPRPPAMPATATRATGAPMREIWQHGFLETAAPSAPSAAEAPSQATTSARGAPEAGAAAPDLQAQERGQSYLGALRAAANQALISGVGQMVTGAGEVPSAAALQAAHHTVNLLDQIDAGNLLPIPQRSPEYERYLGMTGTERAKLRAHIQAEIPSLTTAAAAPNLVTRAGAAVTAFGKSEFPVSPAQKGIGTETAGTVGGVLPYLAVGAVAPEAAVAPLLATGIFAQTFAGTRQQALAKGIPIAEADRAAMEDAAMQAGTMSLPIADVVRAVPAPFRDGFLHAAQQLATSGVEFATFNDVARFAHNYVLRETIDPHRSLTNGITLRSTATTLLAGAVVPAIHMGASAVLRGVGAAAAGAARGSRPAASEDVRQAAATMRSLGSTANEPETGPRPQPGEAAPVPAPTGAPPDVTWADVGEAAGALALPAPEGRSIVPAEEAEGHPAAPPAAVGIVGAAAEPPAVPAAPGAPPVVAPTPIAHEGSPPAPATITGAPALPASTEPTASGVSALLAEHTTRSGKTLLGTVRHGISQADARAIDPYSFRKDNGWFIRLKALPQAEQNALTGTAAPPEAGAQASANINLNAFQGALAAAGSARHDGTWRIVPHGPERDGGFAVEHTDPAGVRSIFHAENGQPGWSMEEARAAATTRADAIRPFETPEPSTAGAKTQIGQNGEGEPVFEDQRGIRSVVRGGVRVTEPVRIIPGGAVAPRPDADRSAEFLPVAAAAPETPPLVPSPLPTSARAEIGEGGTQEPTWGDLGAPVGADNKAVVPAIADEALARLREAHDVLAHGGDEMTDAAGEALAAFHMEAGARSFGDFQRVMLADLGQIAEPFLRKWYEAARSRLPDLDAHLTPTAEIEPLPSEPSAPILASAAERAEEAEHVGERDQLPGLYPERPLPGRPAGEQPPVAQSDRAQPGLPEAAGSSPSRGVGAAAPNARPRADRSSGPRAQPERPAIGGGPGGGDAGRGGSAGQPEGGAAPGSAHPVEAADPNFRGTDFDIAPGALEEERSPRRKAEGNIAAIRLAKRLTTNETLASRAEQEVLAKYVGWGGLAGAFPHAGEETRPEFREIDRSLRELLTPDEHREAQSSTQYAHYTSEAIVRTMWAAVEHLGFTGGLVFEPGMGVGNFIGMMPPDIKAQSRYAGIERDPITGQIAKLLYPQSGVRIADFTEAPLPHNTFDLVIGNPPFSDAVVHADPAYRARRFVLHDYFFAKSIDSLRPGGLLAFVTSAGTMNKLDSSAREYMAMRARFLGGVRLPSDAFSRNAGTEVTTDILFLQKRDEPLAGPAALAAESGWTDVVQRDLPNAAGDRTRGNVSAYFSAHPEQVLGQEGFFDKLYKDRYAVHATPGADFPLLLNDALLRLPAGVYVPPEGRRDLDAFTFESPETKEGSFYVGPDGSLMQYSDGVGRAVQSRGKGIEGGKTSDEAAKIRGLIPIRDALRNVLIADIADDAESGAPARAALNRHYDAFVAKHGPINKEVRQYRRPNATEQETAIQSAREDARALGAVWDEGSFDPTPHLGDDISVSARARAAMRQRLGTAFREATLNPADLPDVPMVRRPNLDPMRDDPENYRLSAIEDYDNATNLGTKRPVFTTNVIRREVEPEIKSANDALLWSLNKLGRLDLEKMASQLGGTVDSTIDALGDAIFRLPGTDASYQTKFDYLSGDVVSKLETAIQEAERTGDPQLQTNILALKGVQPIPLAAEQITMGLGMPWIGPEVHQRFVQEHLGLPRTEVLYQRGFGNWIAKHTVGIGEESGASVWSVPNFDTLSLLTAALNNRPPRVYAPGPEPKTVVFDPIATQTARDLITRMGDEFETWIKDQPDLQRNLTTEYNDKMNRTVPRRYDGSYLTTPGIAPDWQWRPHQRRVIERIIQSGNTYMAHAIGAGKTSAMLGAAMEMKRLGLIRKPMFAVPNHMLGQFTREFYMQYPTARIAVADERQFHTRRRRKFIANIAQNDYDAVIITHSSFGKMPVSRQTEAVVIGKEIGKLQESTAGLDPKRDKRTIKKIENAVLKLEQRLKGARGAQDVSDTFEETGVDFLFVDEAHQFRKLQFATRQQGVKGIDPEGSQMAWDLYSKVSYLESEHPGRSLVLASGTPVTNTMGELYTISRYLQERALETREIAHFDAWSSTFGRMSTKLERSASGGYDRATRFSRFVNVPELYQMVSAVMDIVTPQELGQYVTLPKLKGGERQMHLAPHTEALSEFQHSLALRMEAIKHRRGPPKKGDDIILNVINDGRHATIDMRFVKEAADDPSSKLNKMIDNVIDIHRRTAHAQFSDPANGYETPTTRGPATQMIFANLGVNAREPTNFSAYAWIRRRLLQASIPAREIAVIGDFDTAVKRQQLFNDMNDGNVRILLGSTQKMGTGVNAQRRLIAVHNLDPLWYPADDEQRVGRILRQGNQNPEIEVHDYSTIDTYDSQMWAMMGRKARFIEQFFRGDPDLRRMEDMGEASAYEQAAAMAISDPRVMRLAELKKALDTQNMRQVGHAQQRSKQRREAAAQTELAEYYDRRAAAAERDIAQRVETKGEQFAMEVAGRRYTKRPDASAALKTAIESSFIGLRPGQSTPIGSVGGFPIEITSNPRSKSFETTLKLNGGMAQRIGDQNSPAGGMIQSAERFIGALAARPSELQAHAEAARKAAAAATAEAAKPFEGAGTLAQLREDTGKLEAELSEDAEAKKQMASLEDEPTPLTLPEDEEGEGDRVAPGGRAAYSRRPLKSVSLATFLQSHGGIKDYHGELRALDLRLRFPGLLRKTGLSLDYAREAAVQAGYLPEDADINDLLGKLAEQAAGHTGFTPTEEGVRWAEDSARKAQHEQDRIVDLAEDMRARAHRFGIPLSAEAAEHAAAISLVEGLPEDQAIERAARNADAETAEAILAEPPAPLWQRGEAPPTARDLRRLSQAAATNPLISARGRLARARLYDAAEAMMRYFGLPPSVGLHFVDRLSDEANGEVDGSYERSLVALALDTPNHLLPGKLLHEAMHALLDPSLGLLTNADREALYAAADRWLDQKVRGLVTRRDELGQAGYGASEMRDEAVARLAEGALDRATAPPLTPATAALDRMTGFLRGVGQMLRGRGYRTADGVFRDLLGGARATPQAAARLALVGRGGDAGAAGKPLPPPAERAAPTSELTNSELMVVRARAAGPAPPDAYKGPEYARRLRSSLQRELGLPPQKAMDLAHEAADEVLRWLAPVQRGPDAQRMAHLIRRRGSLRARSSDRTHAALDHFALGMDRLPTAEQLAVTERAEAGLPEPDPALQRAMEALRAEQAEWLSNIQKLGPGMLAAARENYMGHIWANYDEWRRGLEPEGGEGAVMADAAARLRASLHSNRPLRGSASFLKQRTFDTQAEGIKAGLIPVTNNPIRLQVLKLREMQKFFHATRLAQEIKQSGLAVWVPASVERERDARGDGFVKLNDSIFQPLIPVEEGFGRRIVGGWWAPEPAARVFNNYVSQGLSGHSRIYDALRSGNNALNRAQLGLSGFHATFVAVDGMTSQVALAVMQAERSAREGDTRGLVGAAKTAGMAWAAPVHTYRLGSALRQAWLDPAAATPAMKHLADLLNTGGGRVGMDAIYRIGAAGTFVRSLKDLKNPKGIAHDVWSTLRDSPLVGPFRLAARAIETVSEPLMGHLVPRMKLGIFADLARDWASKNPGASDEETAAAMTRFWDSVENRLGQVTYDNLFWNKTLKDCLFVTGRSVGWNLGTVRELGGGVIDSAHYLADVARGRSPTMTTRIAYMLAMPFVTAMIGAIYTFLATGRGPQQMLDLFFPPTGTKTNGIENRTIIPGYMKDVIAWSRAPGQTLTNKASPLLETFFQLYENRDYYGASIYDPERDNPLAAYPEYLLGQAVPFSWRGWYRQERSGASLFGQAMAFWGFQPAPASITNPGGEEAWHEREMRAAYRRRLREEAR